MSSNPIISLFHNRNFVYLWSIQTITQIGANMLLFILAVQVYSVSNSNTAVGLLFLVYGVPNVALAALAGALVDRVGAKKMILISNLFRVPILLLFIFLHGNVVAALILAFIFSVVTQFFFPAGGAILPTLVNKGELLAANSFFSFTFYLSLLLGFTGAGFALKIFGDTGIYVFLSFGFLLATFLSSFLPPKLNFWPRLKFLLVHGGYKNPHFKVTFPINNPIGVIKNTHHHLRLVSKDLWHVVLLIYRKPVIFSSLLLLGFTQVTLAILLSLSPGFSVRVLNIPLTDASTFIILPAGLGMLIGALFLARFAAKWPKKAMRLYGLYSIGCVLFLLYPVSLIIRLPHLTGILLFILGFGNALIDVPSQTILQEETDPEIRGRIFGILSTVVTAGATLPVVVVTVLADLIGVGRVLLFVGAGVLFFTVVYQLSLSRFVRYFPRSV